jgi:predicted phosphate transport protein (TIGR00153 family)
MFRRLLPKETSFFDYFEQHIGVTIRGCEEMLALTSNPDNFAFHAGRIKEIEHEADDVTHACVEALHNTFITPMDRPDIQRLIMRMDDIMDAIDAAASRMAIYNIKEIRPEARELAHVLVEASVQLGEALKLMRNMKDAESIKVACIKVHDLENKGDEILRNALARLFREEEGNPILVIKWNELFEILESAVDKCEDAADVIEGVVIEAS